ncbi:MAG: alpha/beta fold hydrolase [Gemmatimonadetes bacterium]|nr:alpha/beta fold hydrolase [Gemmatimonadota bacterium]
MLEFDRHMPEKVQEGAPLIVLLHGRGSDKDDLMGLQPYLPQDAILVAPRAPFPAAPWGYGPGWAWYRFLGEDRPDPESFEQSQRQLGNFLRELPGQLPATSGPLVLGGFSQGGTMSLAFALRHPGEVGRVLNFSGFLANHPSVRVTAETVRGTRIFWGHGTNDPNIPFELAREGRGRLQAAGAELEARDYPIGHWIDPSELRDAVDWLQR